MSVLISPPSDMQPRAVATSESQNEGNGSKNSLGNCLRFIKGVRCRPPGPPAWERGEGEWHSVCVSKGTRFSSETLTGEWGPISGKGPILSDGNPIWQAGP
jgi:hypothetical protein